MVWKAGILGNVKFAKVCPIILCNSAMVGVTRISVSDSDHGSSSEDLNCSTILLKKFRQRERMKKLHTGLRALRSMVPTGGGSLAEDTAAYVQQLRAETQILQAEIHREEARLQQGLLSNKPAEDPVKVQMDASGLMVIDVQCEKRPGVALALSRVIDRLELSIIQASMRCQDRISLHIFSKKAVRGVVVDPVHVKTLLQEAISYCPCNPGTAG